MVKLIIGKKGSGKTKRLMDMVNAAAKESKGNVVCVEKGDTLKFSIDYKVKLVDVETYNISGYAEYIGLITGICAGNYDVTHVFGDATLRIGSRDMSELTDFVKRIDTMSNEVEFVFTVSADEADIPEILKPYILA